MKDKQQREITICLSLHISTKQIHKRYYNGFYTNETGM